MINGEWAYSAEHGEFCKVIESQTLWGATTCRVWLPGRDSVVCILASRLKSLESVGTGSADDIAYVAYVARVANALTQHVLLAPLEASVTPLPLVRNYRLNLLAQEERSLRKQIDQKSQAYPAMVLLLMIRVEGGE